MVAGSMARSQRPQGTQQVADGALADRKNGGQDQDDKAQEGRPGEGTCQRLEEGAGRLWQLLVDPLQLAASSTCLAHLASASRAVETASATGLAPVRPRRAAPAGRGRALAWTSGYTGHRSLLDVNAGLLTSLHQEGSSFARHLKKGRSRT